MLPLVVAAAQHQGVLHPDTHPGQMQASIDERPAEIEALRIRVKNISRPSRFQVGDHVCKGLEEETVKVIPLDGVILDGQSIRGLEGDTIGGIGQDEVGFLPAHQRGHVLGGGGIAAHQAVPAHRPDIAPLHEGGFLQGSGEVKTVIVRGCLGEIGEHGGELLLVKTCGIHVRAAGSEFGQQGRQLFIVPFASNLIESDVQPLFIRISQINNADFAFSHPQIQKNAEPLVSAHNIPCAAVPDDRFHVPE